MPDQNKAGHVSNCDALGQEAEFKLERRSERRSFMDAHWLVERFVEFSALVRKRLSLVFRRQTARSEFAAQDEAPSAALNGRSKMLSEWNPLL